jgi:hypothetical protein
MMSAPLYALDTVPPALLRRRRTALTPTISDLFAAEADTDGLLDLHREMAGSDIGDPDVARALSVRMSGQRRALIERKNELQEEIDRIQELLLRQYATGAASIDDWLD